jgi:Na+-transporting NADH:ubiquinone oxidoreductase subunit NqrF
MLIKRKSPFSDKVNEMEIAVTEEQLADWRAGTLIQNAMPNLTADEREFIMTGITAEEWEATFGASD